VLERNDLARADGFHRGQHGLRHAD
jgi:hypothetical protein